MGDKESPWTEIDRRLEGDPLEVGGRTVQPVGRLKGKQITAGNAKGGGSGFLAKLEPVEVVVRGYGEERTIPLVVSQQEPLREIVMMGSAVAMGCIAVMVVVHRLVKRAVKRHNEEVK